MEVIFKMVLKTDYKDAMYDGARKWRITQNADGTSGIADETGYTRKAIGLGLMILILPILLSIGLTM